MPADNDQNKTKKLKYGAMAALAMMAIVALASLFPFDSKCDDRLKARDIRNAHTRIAIFADHWSMSLDGMVRTGKLGLDEFEKIDFSRRGDDGYGDDADNEFFNPDGRFGKLGLPEFEQSYIDAVTTKKNTKLIFNLRRYTQKDGKIRDVLYMIIPNYNVAAAGKKVDAPTFEIAEDNKTIIMDEGFIDSSAILTLDEDRKYAFFAVFWRAKYSGDKEWQIY